MRLPPEKRPRQYAAEIAAMRTRSERAQAIETVPPHLRDWVAKLVVMAWERKREGDNGGKAS